MTKNGGLELYGKMKKRRIQLYRLWKEIINKYMVSLMLKSVILNRKKEFVKCLKKNVLNRMSNNFEVDLLLVFNDRGHGLCRVL